MCKDYNMRNTHKQGYGVPKLPLYWNNKFIDDYVIYMGDLPKDHVEIATLETMRGETKGYYSIDLNTHYVIVEDEKVIVNECFYSRDYINENYFERMC